MDKAANYIEINKKAWNQKTGLHIQSDFYDNAGFLNGKCTLNSIELDLLGDVAGKAILHLQCHFGQDSISLSRRGAAVTAIDLSDEAITHARAFARQTNSNTRFICCNVYDLPQHLTEQFDIVFSSYGTIGWLPDLGQWAGLIARYLKPGGSFVFAEFHPVVWMFDDEFAAIKYRYFNSGPIIETETGTYADKEAAVVQETVSWNHSSSEVLSSLLKSGLEIKAFNEFDYSPYNCFNHTEEAEPGKFRIKHMGNNIPLVFSLLATKASIS